MVSQKLLQRINDHGVRESRLNDLKTEGMYIHLNSENKNEIMQSN